nr:hypothetical protein HK105_005775 [Polyrhizophydium stewartii]
MPAARTLVDRHQMHERAATARAHATGSAGVPRMPGTAAACRAQPARAPGPAVSAAAFAALALAACVTPAAGQWIHELKVPLCRNSSATFPASTLAFDLVVPATIAGSGAPVKCGSYGPGVNRSYYYELASTQISATRYECNTTTCTNCSVFYTLTDIATQTSPECGFYFAKDSLTSSVSVRCDHAARAARIGRRHPPLGAAKDADPRRPRLTHAGCGSVPARPGLARLSSGAVQAVPATIGAAALASAFFVTLSAPRDPSPQGLLCKNQPAFGNINYIFEDCVQIMPSVWMKSVFEKGNSVKTFMCAQSDCQTSCVLLSNRFKPSRAGTLRCEHDASFDSVIGWGSALRVSSSFGKDSGQPNAWPPADQAGSVTPDSGNDKGDGGHGISRGAVIGISIGGFVVLVVCMVVATVLVHRNRLQERRLGIAAATTRSPPTMAAGHGVVEQQQQQQQSSPQQPMYAQHLDAYYGSETDAESPAGAPVVAVSDPRDWRTAKGRAMSSVPSQGTAQPLMPQAAPPAYLPDEAQYQLFPIMEPRDEPRPQAAQPAPPPESALPADSPLDRFPIVEPRS